jgi:hypothetical protein
MVMVTGTGDSAALDGKSSVGEVALEKCNVGIIMVLRVDRPTTSSRRQHVREATREHLVSRTCCYSIPWTAPAWSGRRRCGTDVAGREFKSVGAERALPFTSTAGSEGRTPQGGGRRACGLVLESGLVRSRLRVRHACKYVHCVVSAIHKRIYRSLASTLWCRSRRLPSECGGNLRVWKSRDNGDLMPANCRIGAQPLLIESDSPCPPDRCR